MLSRDPSTPRRAQMLQEMHFRNIAQRATLRKRTEEAARYLEATRYGMKLEMLYWNMLNHDNLHCSLIIPFTFQDSDLCCVY